MPLPQPPLGLRLLIQPSCQEMLALARELGSTVVKIAPRVRRRSLKRVPYPVGKGSWSKSHVLANRPSHGCSRILSPIFAQQAMRHVLVLCTTEAHWSRSARRTLGTGAVHAHGMDRLSLDIAAASTRRASPSPFDLYFSTFSR